MRTGKVSGLSMSLLELIAILQASLEEEWFGFVSDEIDEILDQPMGPRGRLLALREVVHKLGLATPVLANSTCDEIDGVAQAIKIDLANVFDGYPSVRDKENGLKAG